MARITFPVLTSPSTDQDDFLARFQELAASEFEHLIAVAPYVDGKLVENLLRGFLFNKRKLTIITRYGNLFKVQKARVRKAVKKLEAAAAKDPTMSDRIVWYVNPRLHAKFVIKDWECVLFGSQNFTYSALKGNYELGAFIEQIDDFRPALEAFLLDIMDSRSKVLFPSKGRNPKRGGKRKRARRGAK